MARARRTPRRVARRRTPVTPSPSPAPLAGPPPESVSMPTPAPAASAPSIGSLDEMVEEGLLIAVSTVRLAVKNRIIVSAIRDQVGYDPESYRDMAAEEIGVLVRQNETAARRMERERAAARTATGATRHGHDYRMADVEQLDLRNSVYESLARALRALVGDEQQMNDLVEAARRAAWDDVAAALREKTRRSEEYESGLVERLQEFVDDLAALERPGAAVDPAD